jgi:hypothetical protein
VKTTKEQRDEYKRLRRSKYAIPAESGTLGGIDRSRGTVRDSERVETYMSNHKPDTTTPAGITAESLNEHMEKIFISIDKNLNEPEYMFIRKDLLRQAIVLFDWQGDDIDRALNNPTLSDNTVIGILKRYPIPRRTANG